MNARHRTGSPGWSLSLVSVYQVVLVCATGPIRALFAMMLYRQMRFSASLALHESLDTKEANDELP
jgi:hypothetical protein